MPNATRWNSTFDAGKCVFKHLQQEFSKFNTVCDALNVQRFTKFDILLPNEFAKILIPILIVLNRLQV